MKNAYIQLIKAAINSGFTVSVWDGEEWQVKRSTKEGEIIDAVKSVEEANLKFRDADGNNQGFALVSAFGLEPDETVIDCSANRAWIDAALGWN